MNGGDSHSENQTDEEPESNDAKQDSKEYNLSLFLYIASVFPN